MGYCSVYKSTKEEGEIEIMALSEEGKFLFKIMIFAVISVLLLVLMMMLFRPIEYSVNCSVDGVSIGIDKELNFTGFNLNDSEIKCDIAGEVPLIVILGSFWK